MKKQKQEQTGQVNFVWALAGGYLIYLGGNLLYSLYRDGARQFSGSGGCSRCGGVHRRGFLAAAPGMEGVSVRRRHKDDPSTWNDDPVEEELPADNGDEEEDPL